MVCMVADTRGGKGGGGGAQTCPSAHTPTHTPYKQEVQMDICSLVYGKSRKKKKNTWKGLNMEHSITTQRYSLEPNIEYLEISHLQPEVGNLMNVRCIQYSHKLAQFPSFRW